MINKKVILDNLYYGFGNQWTDFYISRITKRKDNVICSKWKKYSQVVMPLDYDEANKLDFYNQRQVLANEIVLDIEERNQIQDIITKLNKLSLKNYTVFDTCSRGYHIHIFFKKILTESEKLKIINYFGTDINKAYTKTMIALEYCKHWKSGQIKKKVCF